MKTHLPTRREEELLRARALSIIKKADELAAEMVKDLKPLTDRDLIYSQLKHTRNWLKTRWQPWYDGDNLLLHIIANQKLAEKVDGEISMSMASYRAMVVMAEHMAKEIDKLDGL